MIKEHLQLQLFNKGVFEKAILKPPFRLTAEMPDEACFYYVVQGCADTITNTERVHLKSNEGMVMKCGTYLNEYLETEGVEYCEAIAVHFYPEVLKMIYDKEFPDFLLNANEIEPLRYEKFNANKTFKNYIDSLQFYFENPQLVSEELLKLKLKEIILLLAKTDQAQAIKRLIGNLFTKQEVDFKETIEANLFTNFSLDELAALTNLSLSSFKREFSKHYDISPARYIKQRKLEKAAKMLKTTSLRISDVAYDCGFSDLAHFSKSFQKQYNVPPSEYRLN